MTYALKFISGKYQGGEFPLKLDKQIIIGRSSDLDMVLVEDMVSRKHAKISVGADGRISIEDLGSTNGTFVNGEKVKKGAIKEGDRILIGTSILKLVQTGGVTHEFDEHQVKKNLEEVAAAGQSRKSSSMAGKIEEIPLPDLLQLFNTSKKTGVLVVRGEQEAKLYLRSGRVYYAVIDDNHDYGPKKSFNRIITWEEGEFELSPGEEQSFLVELDESTESLLMDGLRVLDEFKRIEKSLPGVNAALSLASPLMAALRDLNPDELDVIQQVYNYGSMRGLMDHSDKDDAQVGAILLSLISREYVQVG